MTSSLRVLVLTNLFPRRPGEKQGNFVLDQIGALARLGADVSVMTARPWSPLQVITPQSKRKIDQSEYDGAPFHLGDATYFSLPRFALGARAYRFAERGIVPKLKAMGSFDVVHAHGLLMGHVAVQYAKASGIPSVVTIHGVETHPAFDDTSGKRRLIGEVLERADRVVVVGTSLVGYCGKYSSRKDNLVVVGNGFSIYPDLVPSTRIQRRSPIRVVAVSNYEESKGFDLLIEALASPELRGKMESVVVGGGEGFEKLRKRAAAAGVGDFIHFTGLLTNREALAEVMAGDIFCLPSWREAYGIMYAEAMGLGKFTMGCKGQGPSDFIQHLDTGYLMEAGSTAAVTEGLQWAMSHKEEASAIAKRGQAYALRCLTWDANAGKIMEIYQRLIAGNRAPESRESRVAARAGTRVS